MRDWWVNPDAFLPPLQLEFIKEIGFTHMRILEGVSTVIQLGGLLARLCKMVSCTPPHPAIRALTCLTRLPPPATGPWAVQAAGQLGVTSLPSSHRVLYPPQTKARDASLHRVHCVAAVLLALLSCPFALLLETARMHIKVGCRDGLPGRDAQG